MSAARWRADRGVIPARMRSCPRHARPVPLEIRKHLPHQRQQRQNCLPPRESRFHQDARGCFHESQSLPCDHRASGVIRRFVSPFDHHWNAPKRPRDISRRPQRAAVAFDREDDAVQIRDPSTAKRLQRMNRAGRSAKFAQRLKYTAIKRPARMQDDLSAPLLAANFRQIARHILDRVIRRGDQNQDRRRQPGA